MTTSTSLARRERDGLADALLAAGPDAPTLCEGWTALDLAAHVVVREARPDSLPGLAGGPLGRWTDRVRRGATVQGIEALVRRLRSGPPPWSPFAIPGVDARGNLLEYVVHHEDVRRGTGAGPRDPLATRDLQDAVWRMLPGVARLNLRKVRAGVTLRRDDVEGPATTVKTGPDAVVIVGAPVEIALFLFGRRGAARVALEGSADGIRKLTGADLRT
jgi:uncharacterized protein (TIGR03085 family)